MSYTVACPICTGAVPVRLQSDYNGDGIWGTPTSTPFIEGCEAGCDLSEAQYDALLESIDDDDLTDYYAAESVVEP